MKETKPKPFVFVLMPFSAEFNNIYELGIKPACREAGAYCERVDEQIFEENIMERVYNQIAKADIIVSEMTGRNPNVFYETGYAHALNKRVILLTAKAEDIPFDLKHYPHIVHNGQIKDLKSQLKDKIRWYLNNSRNQMPNIDVPDISGLWYSYHFVDNANEEPVGEVRFEQRGNVVKADIKVSRRRDGSAAIKEFKLNGKLVAGNLAFINEETTVLRGLVVGAGVVRLSGNGKEFIGKITYFYLDTNKIETFDLRLVRA
ncbi:MAG TPA: hypothetical protein VF599_08265 [Pyrinomonadaceae bacterium]|jgi:hypothetical protein